MTFEYTFMRVQQAKSLFCVLAIRAIFLHAEDLDACIDPQSCGASPVLSHTTVKARIIENIELIRGG